MAAAHTRMERRNNTEQKIAHCTAKRLMASAFRFVSRTVYSRTQLSTDGDRAFPVAAVWIWNSLPQHITSAPSLPFCSCLKTYFFKLCYP